MAKGGRTVTKKRRTAKRNKPAAPAAGAKTTDADRRTGELTPNTSDPVPESPPAKPKVAETDPSGLPVVDYRSVRCPNCGSARVSTRSTQRLTASVARRYHTCENCKADFKSVEAVPPVDVSHYGSDASKPAAGAPPAGEPVRVYQRAP